MRLRIGTVGMVTAAMVSVLSCYTLSLRVSAERSKVEELRGHIAGQMRDIRALEAELKTRSRLPQLQRWNDNVLALAAPTAKQYADTPVQLASFAPGAPKQLAPVPAVVHAVAPQAAANPLVHAATYTVPSSPVAAPMVDDDPDSEAPARPAPEKAKPAPVKPAEVKPLKVAEAKPKAEKPVEVAMKAAPAPKKAKAPDAKGLDSLFGDIDKAATTEHAKLVKVSLR